MLPTPPSVCVPSISYIEYRGVPLVLTALAQLWVTDSNLAQQQTCSVARPAAANDGFRGM